MSKLNSQTLTHLGKNITVPTYDRFQITDGIVHFGVGGFHRAHEAVYVDDLLQKGVTDWGICGVGLLTHDARMRDALMSQDELYTVIERSVEGDKARVIGSLTKYLFAPENPGTVLDKLTSDETRIVSLTITEGGYNVNHATGEFNAEHPSISHDLEYPDEPVTVFGHITEALHQRRQQGKAPFTVLSCDNLQSNGDTARHAILAFAALRDHELSQWIGANVTFPNCMVDRITPQTTLADREMVLKQFGIDDAWPVVTEPFRQWIIEDKFCNGRPAFEDVGAQMTSDVHPYEMMKIRLLNASHSAMGCLGYLAGYRTINAVMEDRQFREFIVHLMDDEVTPLLAPVPGVDLPEYKRTLITRFANPKIGDQVSRICLDGSSKMPKFILASIHDALAQNRPMDRLVLAVAGWFRYLTGFDEQGAPILIEDPMAEILVEKAKEGRADPRNLLSIREIFGDLADSTAFVEQLSASLRHVYAEGAKAAVAKSLK